MIEFSDAKSCVMYMPHQKAMYIAVDGFIGSENIRSLISHAQHLCETKGIRKVLFDSRLLEVVGVSDMKWLLSEAIPAFRKYSLEQIACVKPEHIFGQNTLQKLRSSSTLASCRMFDSLELAEDWLFHRQREKVFVG